MSKQQPYLPVMFQYIVNAFYPTAYVRKLYIIWLRQESCLRIILNIPYGTVEYGACNMASYFTVALHIFFQWSKSTAVGQIYIVTRRGGQYGEILHECVGIFPAEYAKTCHC